MILNLNPIKTIDLYSIIKDIILNVIIIIPTYNEASCIENTINSIEKTIENIDQKISILVFDSDSNDGTTSIIQSLQKKFNNIFLFSESEKTGLGSAYMKAMQLAIDSLYADIIIEFDADGSHQPIHIISMLETIKSGADVVLGSRYIRGGKIDAQWPWSRFLISQIGNLVARAILTSRYKDFTSGFRATKSIFLKPILAKGFLSKNYAYKIHLLWELHQEKAKIIEIPIHFIDRTEGYSKFPKNNISESFKVVLLLRFQSIMNYFQ